MGKGRKSAFANILQAVKRKKKKKRDGRALPLERHVLSAARELLYPANPSARSSVRGVQH